MAHTEDGYDSVVEEAKARFKLSSDADAEQRQREIDDLRFQVPEFQWDDASKAQRSGGSVTGVPYPLPPRPTLSIPKLDQPIQIVLNQERQAHLGVNVHPLSEDSNKDTAEVIQGLYRKIQRDSRAHIARSWAYERAVKAGRGAYRVGYEYDEEGGHPFDQKITISRILYQNQVYWDPSAQEPDYSDGNYAFITAWIPYETFKRLHPEATMSSSHDNPSEWTPRETDMPDWVKSDGSERHILVAEYFRKVYETDTVFLLENGQAVVVPAGQIKKAEKRFKSEGVGVITQRERHRPVVQWHKLAGIEDKPLESKIWNGKYIPLIPVIGRELQPFDNERRWTGIIGPAKDAQRLFNYAASGLVEMAALEPRAPWIMDARQIEGYEAYWMQSNTRNFPYLPYKATNEGEQPIPMPARVQVDANRMGPNMMLVQQADNFIQSSTAMFDPMLGRMQTERERSGKAIQSLQGMSDLGNSHFLNNLAEISMTLEAKIVLDLMGKVYERPGRILEILDNEDKGKTVMVNQEFSADDGGVPQPTEQGQGKMYDLTKGVYGVSIKVGRSYQSRLEQGSEEIGQILQSSPELVPLIGPTYFNFRDFPGAQEVSEILTKMRDQQYPFLKEDEGNTPSPAEMMNMLRQAKQENEQLQKALQQLQQEIDTKKAQQGATIESAKIKAENAAVLAQLQATAAQAAQQNEENIKRMELMFKEALEAQKLEHDERAREDTQAHERIMQDDEQAHERGMEGLKAALAPEPKESKDGEG